MSARAMSPGMPLDDPRDGPRVIVITNLTRNVAEVHLKAIFGFYGDIVQMDLPTFGKSGQNRGKAALEFTDAPSASKAASYMNGGQIDGAVVKVELSNLPVRSRSPRPYPGRARPRSYSRSRSRSRSPGGFRRGLPSLTFALSHPSRPRTSRPTEALPKLFPWRLWATSFTEQIPSFQSLAFPFSVAFPLLLVLLAIHAEP
ncbi:RNA-binding domain-containing protein [Mycena kentingensis (nom. inval.)]|nr:RNA-binding domain-containing protein [Mycena kentingensis (nom. inval.)]